MARIGKIARLPEPIRVELNQRLRGGALGPQILPWLNGLPEVREVLREFFDGAEINPQNLSDWRNGGYEEWLEKQDRHWQHIEHTREMAQLSLKLAQAGGYTLNDGTAMILGGKILSLIEELEGLSKLAREDIQEPEKLKSTLEAINTAIEDLATPVARLRAGDHNRETLRQNEEKLRQKDDDLKLAREAFEQKLREYQDKVAAQKREIEGALGAARSGGITPETLKRIEEAAALL